MFRVVPRWLSLFLWIPDTPVIPADGWNDGGFDPDGVGGFCMLLLHHPEPGIDGAFNPCFI